ncbi:MAG: hypothetical protein J4G16_14305 [Acidobacteria bacterium]|nr:hypothetical protein [Acidobacteriota bacterium]
MAPTGRLVEALRIHARISGVDHNRKLLLDRILRARIPDEFAKMALLRVLAGDRKPDRRSAAPVDLEQLGTAQREAVAERLKEVLAEMQGWGAKAARKAIDELESRRGKHCRPRMVRRLLPYGKPRTKPGMQARSLLRSRRFRALQTAVGVRLGDVP